MAQRILTAHKEISSTSEPWILLPYLYTLRDTGTYTEYNHSVMAAAIEDFCHELPNGVSDYLAEMRTFTLRLYAKAASDETRYFLDKTPRYHLVSEEVVRLFPEGKFIFLWRNPLAIVASIIETWGAAGKWNLYRAKVDLFSGLANLVATYQRFKEQACAVRYEDLVTKPEEEWERILSYLGLSFDPGALSQFGQVRFRGQMGDPTGTERYQTVSKEPLDKWKYTLANPVRKVWCRRYLRWIGRHRLATMGYDLNELVSELDSIPSSAGSVGSDMVRIVYGTIYTWGEPTIFSDKLRRVTRAWSVHVHR
jgi:hypothetical protein